MNHIHLLIFLPLLWGCSAQAEATINQKNSAKGPVATRVTVIEKEKADKPKKISDARKQSLLNWCNKGLSAACIDYIYFGQDEPLTRSINDKSLIDYCEEGNGSACYYMSKLEPKYRERACQHKDMRGCPESLAKTYSLKSPAHCKTTSPDSVKFNTKKKGKTIRSEYLKEILDEINSNEKIIKFCYERKLSRSADIYKLLKGRIRLKFTVDLSKGNFYDITEKCSDFYDKEISNCIVESFRAFHVNLKDLTKDKTEESDVRASATFVKSYSFSQK